MSKEDKFWVVFNPALQNRTRKFDTFKEAVERAKMYSESIPSSKFFVCETIGGFEHEITDFEINQIEIEK